MARPGDDRGHPHEAARARHALRDDGEPGLPGDGRQQARGTVRIQLPREGTCAREWVSDIAEARSALRHANVRAIAGDGAIASRERARASTRLTHFRISSPLDGDRYQLPPGVDAPYATIALSAEGSDPARVRWFVDGRPTIARRLPLLAGTHVIGAQAAARDSDEVRVTIER